MKISCDMIQDLLPLYHDGVCSEESKKIIEEHLQICERCKEELHLMGAEWTANTLHSEEKVIAKEAAAAWKKGKKRAFILGVLIMMAALGISFGMYLNYHWSTSVTAEKNGEELLQQAEAYLGCDLLGILETTKKGDYLAALCTADYGAKWYICVFERDSVFEDRWRASGGTGCSGGREIISWNYGSSEGEAVLIFGGGNISKEVSWYTFENAGISYYCPVYDHIVLDIFLIPESDDISSYPIMLNQEKEPIEVE